MYALSYKNVKIVTTLLQSALAWNPQSMQPMPLNYILGKIVGLPCARKDNYLFDFACCSSAPSL